MNDEELIAEVRDILAGWGGIEGETLRVENLRRFWLIAGTDPRGVRRSGVRDNPISLARTLASQVGPEPAPEPVAGPVTPDETVLTPGDVSDDASPKEDEGGSFYADDPEDEPDLVGDILDEMALDEHEPGGIGVMVNNIGGVMAADQTEILRSYKIGEVVDHAEDLLERRFNGEANLRWQVLWQLNIGAGSNSNPPLTEAEQDELNDLNVRQLWAGTIIAERQRRVQALRTLSTEDDLRTFNTRSGWPE